MSVTTVSTIVKCQTRNANKLTIYDIARKLKKSGDYDIGGTYTTTPDFWFMYNTALCPGYNYLMNLYVCARNLSNFSIGVSNNNSIFYQKPLRNEHDNSATLYWDLDWYSFRSIDKDQFFYIKTFCFDESDVNKLNNKVLYIPIQIKTHAEPALSAEISNKIKIEHNIGKQLYKMDNKDFQIVVDSGRVFDVHRIILMNESPILRQLAEDSTISSAKINNVTDEEMEMLIEFFYMGSIENEVMVDNDRLINFADKFKLRSVFLLLQPIIANKLNVDNALEYAVLAETYNLDTLQRNIFHFIQENPKVMDSEAWKKLNNVAVTKKMLEYIYLHN